MFETSRIMALITLILLAAGLFYSMAQTQKGVKYYLRRIPGLSVLDECIGRAAEMGRPVHFTPGLGSLSSANAPLTIAGLEVQSYLAKQSATYDVRLITTVARPEVLPVSQEVQRSGHVAAGRPETYREEDVRYLSSDQFAFASNVIGTIEREKAVANIMIGAFAAEAMFLAENSSSLGCITVGGSTNLYQIPFFIAACDYTLIGEEVFAGGAYFSQDQNKVAVLRGQDLGKGLVIASLVIVAIVTLAGNNTLLDLFKQ